MPLPDEGAVWPPPSLRPALDHIAECDTWWAGDTERLVARYGSEVMHPAQHAGGVVGALARLWWGRPVTGAASSKLHVPIAGDIAAAYGTLLYGEAVKVTSAHEPTSKRLDELLDESMQARLLEAGETVGALGGAWLRPMHDAEVSDRPWLDVVAPDAVQPEWRGGRVHAANLWNVVQVAEGRLGKMVWRHIERHEAGRIVHRLYQGGDDRIGRMVPLEDVDALAHLADQVDADGAIETGWPKPSVVYLPRARPNRKWRHLPALAPMGRSLFDGCVPLFDALDETYTSLMRDIRLGRGRIIVGEDALDDRGRGNGAVFDGDREVFTRTAGMSKDTPITVSQFDIRVEPLRTAADELTNVILRRAGLNGSTLGEPGPEGAAMTAREVATRERRSALTREAGIRYQRPEVGDVLGALLALDQRVFGTVVQPLAEISVEYPDSVTEDPTTLAGTAEALHRAQAASTRTRIEIVNPDRGTEWIDAELAAVREEFGIGSAPDPDGDPDDFVEDSITAEEAGVFGTLVRSGVDSVSAAERAGLGDVKLTGGIPVTLRKPDPIEADAPAP